jgi:hypothetical protein
VEISARNCSYSRSDGSQCGSPAVSGDTLCFYHRRDANHAARLRKGLIRKAAAYASMPRPENASPEFNRQDLARFDPTSAAVFDDMSLPPLEDIAAIQAALTAVVRGLCLQLLPERRAGRAIQALRVATATLRESRLQAEAEATARQAERDAANGDDDFHRWADELEDTRQAEEGIPAAHDHSLDPEDRVLAALVGDAAAKGALREISTEKRKPISRVTTSRVKSRAKGKAEAEEISMSG